MQQWMVVQLQSVHTYRELDLQVYNTAAQLFDAIHCRGSAISRISLSIIMCNVQGSDA